MVNKEAHDAVVELWKLTVKTRALCPWTDERAIGITRYQSPPWYRKRGAVDSVELARPLTAGDVQQLQQIAGFVNRSFVISMAAVLEAYEVVPYGKRPDCSKKGGKHAQLTKRLRNHFAHGDWEYDAGKSEHVKTRRLLEELFPAGASEGPGFVLLIDKILEPLKDGVLAYIAAST